MGITLTIDEAKQNSSMFLYVFAPEEFLNAIPAKYAYIIRAKAANQRKILMLSAKEYLGDSKKWNPDYTNAIRDGFMDTYGVTPAEALYTLAIGGQVAGKNWKDGVYGVNGLGTAKFKGTDISVNPKNGYMMRNGSYLPVYDTEYEEIGGKTIPYQLFYYDAATGKRYMSQYYKGTKKYYAESYSTSDGKIYSASTGNEISTKDSATIWSNVELTIEKLQEFLNWLLSLFGINSGSSESDKDIETINTENTAPNQGKDGFCTESGFGEAAAIALTVVAGGTLLAGGFGKKKNKSN